MFGGRLMVPSIVAPMVHGLRSTANMRLGRLSVDDFRTCACCGMQKGRHCFPMLPSRRRSRRCHGCQKCPRGGCR